MAIFFLAKFIKKQEHADEFLQGELFLKPLCYFKNIAGEDGTGDKNEGAILFPLDDFVLTLTPTNPKTGEVSDTIRITKDDLAAPTSLHPRRFDHINVLCMYACHGGDFQSISDDNIDDFRKQLEISEECASLGEHAIIITNMQEFLCRISVAAEKGGYRICGGLVTYYDPMVGTPTTHSGIKSVFHKRKEYQYQSEFRIAVDTHVYEPTSLRLSIGDISDIAFLMRTSEINGLMRFEVGPR